MTEPWRLRVKKWICKHFGHREKRDEWSTWCGRCLVLIAGPLNGGGTRNLPPAGVEADRD